MPNYLAEFRHQYPEYHDIPDQVLVQKLLLKDPTRWAPLLGPLAGPAAGTPGAPPPTNYTGTDVVRGMNRGAGFALPAAGAMVGGTLGLPAGPGGAIVGGGLGGAGGSFLADAVNNAVSYLNPDAASPRGTGQQLQGAAESGIAGMSGEASGQALLGTARRFATRGMSLYSGYWCRNSAR